MSKKTEGMSGQELWAKMQKLGVTQVGFARIIGVGERTMRDWIGGTTSVPRAVAMLVNLMIKTKTAPEDLQG